MLYVKVRQELGICNHRYDTCSKAAVQPTPLSPLVPTEKRSGVK